ncbi:sulfotransferase family protein [Actinomadura oligospora]|uniref:sulfotransferase family protein n=1 Tax=Actinomadura oligospora TaxID=111804 RepID=UPI0004BBDB1D|nr:sulfotransferase family protein [Actinomadura oligospora]
MLDVIGAGFGRTGTLSLKMALERLGFGPCEHMLSLPGDHERIALWRRALAGGPVDWDELFAGYRSAVDWPTICFWQELAGHFSEAKVILTVRAPDKWYESARATLRVPPSWSAPPDEFRDLHALIQESVWEATFGGRFDDRDHAIKVFTEHNARVRRAIAPDRLLVLDVRQGWGPLCEFLDAPVPDTPFPHHNTRADFIAMIEEIPSDAGKP